MNTSTFEVTLLVNSQVKKVIVDAFGEGLANQLALEMVPDAEVVDTLYMGPTAEQTLLPGVL